MSAVNSGNASSSTVNLHREENGTLHSGTSGSNEASVSSPRRDDGNNIVPFKGLSQPAMMRCPDCQQQIPLAEWPNHRDRLRKVEINEHLNRFQRAIVSAIMGFIMWILANVFFREVAVCGLENIPKEGPVVFYGNHQNQFIDALMISAFCGRKVRFIIAEKSMHRPVIGFFANLTKSVPVVRPQDVPLLQGVGSLVLADGKRVVGSGTEFTKSVFKGDVLAWVAPGMSTRFTGQIHSIESDTELTLTLPVPEEHSVHDEEVAYKISRRIDHSDMYAAVYDNLAKGQCIGIFPEGGSHDRTSLQPLKAGVAIFALGASERGIYPTIIPCGLTYFYGHKFRSRAHIEFGQPIRPTDEMVEGFKLHSTRREVTGMFLKELDNALRAVTINVPDWATLKLLHAFRRLYQPPNLLLDESDYLQLHRRLSLIINNHRDDPEFQEFAQRVENYNDYCAAMLIKDSQAATLENLGSDASFRLLARRVVMLTIMAIVLIPFAVIAAPIGAITTVAAEQHARVALSASKVKVVGADVKGSYKLIVGIVAVPLIMNGVSLAAYFISDARIALTIFFALPMAMYVSLLILREFVLELRAALPLIMSLISKHKQFKKLFARRQGLVRMAKEIVLKYDPQLEQEMEQLTFNNELYEVREPSLFSLRHSSRKPRPRRL